MDATLPGFDVAAALRGGITGRQQAWRFARDFAAAWTDRPLLPEDGVPGAELHAAEKELGFLLPAVLREGYALFGRRADLTCGQDPLLPPGGLFVDDGVLIFRVENQSCAFWGIPLGQVERDDPPVVVDSDGRWLPFLDRMSQAWVELLLSETLFVHDSRYDACELPPELLAEFHGRYERVDLPDHPMWVGPDDSPLRWYAAPGLLLRRDGVQDHAWVHAGGRTAADLDAVRAALPARWVVG
ncbi:SMI1/KNR4 family protein [Streptomyces sp. NPDC046977]|uniref:SMI1/KNR4 family protein n=1 Tax=Streptomyces sp. NPDC046977 TaxID=3154703 RepID=UPI0033CDD88F